MAILLPFTFVVQDISRSATSPMIFLAAIYYGAMYRGAISSITLGIPGASTAVPTTFDGRPLALAGKADKVLVTAAVASFIGGTVADLLFTGFAPALASIALGFGNAEVFALMLLAFTTFVGLGGDDVPKTIFSICFGLVLATVGFDIISGEPRLIFFDITGFSHGIRFLVLAIGSTLGFFVGILPAAGATPGSLMAYGMAKMASRHPERFGKGEVDGIVAPESANNAASTGAMLPMMTLGIPGSTTTAVLLAGIVIWGLQPGPLLFTEQPDFVWPLIGSFYISNVIAFVVNLAFIPVFLWMLRMPFTILASLIFVLSIVGTCAAYQRMFDVWLIVLFRLGAYLLRVLDYPLAPAVLAVVLGPIAEPKLRQSLLLSDGDFTIFFTRRIACPITVIAIILILLPLGKLLWRKARC